MKEIRIPTVKPEYPYHRIEKERRDEFKATYSPEMGRERRPALSREVSAKEGISGDEVGYEEELENHERYVEGFVRALLKDGSYKDAYAYNREDHHRSLGYVNGMNTRRELERA